MQRASSPRSAKRFKKKENGNSGLQFIRVELNIQSDENRSPAILLGELATASGFDRWFDLAARFQCQWHG
jgi:hypothetical protein